MIQHTDNITIIQATPENFDGWDQMHALLSDCFAYMAPRISPPSSLNRLTAADLANKAASEDCFIALHDDTLIGCVFGKAQDTTYYLGKLAISPKSRGTGLARRLIACCAARAKELGKTDLELETRIELIENHAAFAALGFRETARTTHAGFSRPTSITFQRPIDTLDT